MAEHPLHIAILDDDRSVGAAISRLLNASGMICVSFSNCIELFDLVERQPLDCILLDLYMAGMDGIEVMQYLQRIKISTPIIVITAYDGSEMRETCLNAGAKGYLRKPLQATELLGLIAEFAGSALPN